MFFLDADGLSQRSPLSKSVAVLLLTQGRAGLQAFEAAVTVVSARSMRPVSDHVLFWHEDHGAQAAV